MACERTRQAWAIRWNRGKDDTALVGTTLHPCRTRLFDTKREAMAHIREEFGYIRYRSDLRAPPFNWRMPRAVRVTISICEVPS